MSACRRLVLRLLATLLCVAASSSLRAEIPSAQRPENVAGTFIRIAHENGEPAALETAIVRYVPSRTGDNFTVDLIAVAHVGEKEYYRRLNEHMRQYDVLLYELVAPKGTRVPKGQPGGLLPWMMKSTLDLESQLEQIDYTPENFVHADLSPDEIARKMEERGQTGLGVTVRAFTEALEVQRIRERKAKEGALPPQPQVGLSVLFDPNGPKKLKRAMAVEMVQMEAIGGLGQTLTTMLIADRNAAVIRRLREQLDQGKRKVGIFYGAAHMPDFERRLTEEFGLKRDREEWLTAWDLK